MGIWELRSFGRGGDVRTVETEIDPEEESKVYKTNLLKDERGKRQTHIDVLLITAVFAIFVERTLSIYSNTEKAMIKHP